MEERTQLITPKEAKKWKNKKRRAAHGLAEDHSYYFKKLLDKGFTREEAIQLICAQFASGYCDTYEDFIGTP